MPVAWVGWGVYPWPYYPIKSPATRTWPSVVLAQRIICNTRTSLIESISTTGNFMIYLNSIKAATAFRVKIWFNTRLLGDRRNATTQQYCTILSMMSFFWAPSSEWMYRDKVQCVLWGIQIEHQLCRDMGALLVLVEKRWELLVKLASNIFLTQLNKLIIFGSSSSESTSQPTCKRNCGKHWPRHHTHQ